MFAKNRIAFGMGDDHRDSVIRQLGERICDLLGDAEIAEFHQQVARAPDDIASGMSQRVLHVLVGKMEIASQADLEGVSDEFLQVGGDLLQIFAVVMIAIVGMGRGHHVGDAVGGSHAAHGHARFPCLRAIVDFGKNVGVDIDHDRWDTAPAGLGTTFDLTRFGGERGRSLMSLTRTSTARRKAHQMVGTAPDSRMARSTVTSASPCTIAVAPMILSAVSFG